MKFTVSVSYYDDGRIGEVFIDNHKQGSAIGTLVRDSAILISFALQYGADIDAIRRALSQDGPIGLAIDAIAEGERSAMRPAKPTTSAARSMCCG